MPYAEGRIFHDADSPLMETQDWLVSYADPKIRERILPPNFNASGRMADAIGKKRDAAHWAAVNLEANLMNLKGWEAFGASDPRERTRTGYARLSSPVGLPFDRRVTILGNVWPTRA